MARKQSVGAEASPRIVNRRARHDYRIQDKLEVGVALRGSEVKSIRQGQVSLAEGYARVDLNTNELWLHDVEISRYPHGGPEQHEPKRPRKLLAHKRQIRQLAGETSSPGVTLVPLAMYFSHGRVKLELGVGVGRKSHDKRQKIQTREAQREMRRGMTRRRL